MKTDVIQKQDDQKESKIIGSIILAVIILLCTGLFISRCGIALIPVTTRYAYKPILKYRWENRSLVEHFPEEIPDKAKNIRFYYRACLFQGGTTIELRMQLPGKEFDSIVQNYRPEAKLILDHLGKPFVTKTEEKDFFTPLLHFYTVSREELSGENSEGPLPAGYEIYLLHLKGYPNHGKTAGIAVSQERKEIIYWAASW